jgi:integrase/recombinase XerD
MEENSMSNLIYKSILAHDFYNFVQMKRNLGYKYTSAVYIVRDLDTFLCSKSINTPLLTKELCEEWMQRRPHEAESTHKGRCTVLIEFSRFMGDIGKPSFIPRMPRIQPRGFTAHIFSDDEIRRFFISCDNLVLKSRKKDSVIIMLPALFRLLYGTGIRISEALSLKCKDVNLSQNFLVLHDTKNRKDRLVPISESLSNVLKEYAYYKSKLPVIVDKDFFFISLAGKACKNDGIIYTWFRTILREARIPHQGKHLGPRVHDFRHTFSIHSLVKMQNIGLDMYCSLPILSMYLGHESIETTNNYLRICESMYPEIIKKIDVDSMNVFPKLIEYETD